MPKKRDPSPLSKLLLKIIMDGHQKESAAIREIARTFYLPTAKVQRWLTDEELPEPVILGAIFDMHSLMGLTPSLKEDVRALLKKRVKDVTPLVISEEKGPTVGDYLLWPKRRAIAESLRGFDAENQERVMQDLSLILCIHGCRMEKGLPPNNALTNQLRKEFHSYLEPA
ncbi:MAG TPA: hypothetical protein VJC12_03230 [Candidatus Paceibacterota bacterium]